MSNNRFANYDSEAVDLVVVGIPITDGKADTFVTITAREKSFEAVAACDGLVTRYATHNRLYDVAVTLKRSSSHNSFLAALHAVDRNSAGGAGVGVFLLKDRNGSTVIAGDKCWIEKIPDNYSFGKDVGDVTWNFCVVATHAAVLPGGN
ncbi:MAG: phage protein [bacterium]